MKLHLIDISAFDPYCLLVCTATVETAPTQAEQAELQQLASAFFDSREKDEHSPRLRLQFQGTTITFCQRATTRMVTRSSFSELLKKLGLEEEKKSTAQVAPAAVPVATSQLAMAAA